MNIQNKSLKKEKDDAMDDTIVNPFISDRSARISKYAVELLGHPGKLLYASKVGKPTTIFNANVYNSKAEKIWYGDIEIERDRKALTQLSDRAGPVYILWEMDGRLLKKPPTIEYVRNVAIVVIENGNITYSEQFKARVKALTDRASRKTGKRRSPAIQASSKARTKKKGEKSE